MPPQKKTTACTKRRIVAPAEKRTQIRLTVDFKFTKTYFSQLFAVLKIRNKNALAEHIIMNFKTKTAQAQIQAFYNGPWLDIPFQSIDTSFVFPLTHEIADELERVGREILGGVNKSKRSNFSTYVSLQGFFIVIMFKLCRRAGRLLSGIPKRIAFGS
jgi:hypothetical protein